ncbi:histidine phosphatase family protein [Oricola cellulosilytica]|uniref:Histidine phosphatase family protein n=1 Tax=Oricola cellulosilytica TaxID=1429082 RepID=A0A4R0PK76_9HYPH|nr:histidine phosphatase family protein [Oricola cellulosilytica]
MGDILYVSHPEVLIDLAIPVPDWPLSAAGRARMRAFAETDIVSTATSVWCSAERKAREGAEIVGARLELAVHEDATLGENDRSATGFVAPPRFWELVEAFFAHPELSIEGWERAVDAQARIMGALRNVAEHAPRGRAVVVAHGGVGALALAALTGQPISRDLDQQAQGNSFRFDRESFALLQGWQPLPLVGETADGVAP